MAHKARQGGHIDIYLGAKIKERRRLLGLTLEDLAKALDLTYQQVQKYEKGINRITVSRLCDISRALKTPISAPIGSNGSISCQSQSLAKIALAGRKETLNAFQQRGNHIVAGNVVKRWTRSFGASKLIHIILYRLLES